MSLAYCIGIHASLRTQIAPEVSQLQKIASNTSVINAVVESNKAHNDLTQLQLHKLNTAWHKQLKSKQQPLLKGMQVRTVSHLLNKQLQDSNGKVQKLNLTDDKGISVAQSPTLKHYWYGYKRSWSKVIALSNGKYYVGRPRMQKKTHERLVDVGVPIENAQHKNIGALIAHVRVPDHKG